LRPLTQLRQQCVVARVGGIPQHIGALARYWRLSEPTDFNPARRAIQVSDKSGRKVRAEGQYTLSGLLQET
jgi:hypothetical protein